jgi:hypothetical protein
VEIRGSKNYFRKNSPLPRTELHFRGHPTGKRETELTENGNFRLFAANEKQKRQTSVCLQQTEIENGSLFFLVGKQK